MSILASLFCVVAACNQVHPFSDEERADIDCLAAITVVEITDAIRAGTEQGIEASVLAEIRPQKIDAAIERLNQSYPGRMSISSRRPRI